MHLNRIGYRDLAETFPKVALSSSREILADFWGRKVAFERKITDLSLESAVVFADYDPIL